jgi:Contractile injection system tape measure protein
MMEQLQQHIIKRATLDLQYNGVTNAPALQQEAKDWLYELLQYAEQTFDTTAADELLVIDELLIDITANGSNWKQEATKQIIKQLQEKVNSVAVHHSPGTSAEKIQQQQARIEKSFLFFLANGYWPWNAAVTTTAETERMMMQDGFYKSDGFTEDFFTVLSKSSWSRIRLLQQFSKQFVETLFKKIIFAKQTEQQLLQDFSKATELLTSIQAPLESRQLLLLMVAETFTKGQAADAVMNHISEAIAALHQTDKAFAQKWMRVQFQSQPFIHLNQQVKEQIQTSTVNTKQAKEEKQQHYSIEKGTDDEMAFISKEGIYISNAGLVIAAVFLPALFKKLELVNDAVITNIDTAVCLTQYLCTGNETIEEQDLVLPKILCGLHPSFPVNTKTFQLSAAIKQEANDVLASVIEHWAVLKETSVQGLQTSFLMRDGKLVHQNKKWMLTVEQKTYDMLLKHLPWNISMLQLSWMKEMLVTEWVY